MGFCFFNNVAVAARHALDVHGLKRVAIIDFDVHHGNGTEDIIAGDERVLMVQLLPAPAVPVQRRACPRAPTWSTCRCRPTPAAPEVRETDRRRCGCRALEAFAPQMIFISAGFDAHREDDLGQLGLVEADYEWITRRMMDVADRHAQGRIVSCLEGGYNLERAGAQRGRAPARAGRRWPERRAAIGRSLPAADLGALRRCPAAAARALTELAVLAGCLAAGLGGGARCCAAPSRSRGSIWFGDAHRRRRAVPGAGAAAGAAGALVHALLPDRLPVGGVQAGGADPDRRWR